MAIAVLTSLAAVIATRLDPPADSPLTADQQTVILKLQSVLLHDSASPQYARVTLQSDDRGYVAGIGDFATADGSALKVIDAYTARVGTNVLSRDYGPTLARLASQGSPDTSELDGYPEAWRAASLDPVFRHAQDTVLETSYLQPAIRAAQAQGVRSPLGIAIFFDALLQHGDAPGPDSLSAVVTLANATRPSTTGDEPGWLAYFLQIREGVLLNPAEPRHQRLWPLTVTRVRTLAQLVRVGAWDLTPPVRVNPYGQMHFLDARPAAFALPSVDPGPDVEATDRPESTSSAGATPTGSVPPGPDRPSGPTLPTAVSARLQGEITGIDGVCLDLVNARIDGGIIKTWECNNSKAQLWAANPDGTISITISPPPEPWVLETACLRPRNGTATPGTEVKLAPCDPADSTQQWRFENGHIRNVGTDRCLAVPDRPDYYGLPVVIAICADVSGQIWSYPH
jgi:chitosanase